jgi:hypothetical protein
MNKPRVTLWASTSNRASLSTLPSKAFGIITGSRGKCSTPGKSRTDSASVPLHRSGTYHHTYFHPLTAL